MNPLAISAANLDTLEHNMLALSDNINNVTHDIININGQISTFNREVSDVKQGIKSLEDEIHRFMEDIRENTIVSRAQNEILIKEAELNKQYGNYDVIRKQLSGLLESVNVNLVHKNTLITESEKVLFSAPQYYLSYVLIAISAWFSNDQVKANSSLNEALKINASKTSLVLCFVHLSLGREKTALRWLKKYLSLQNPKALDNDFVILIEALTMKLLPQSMVDIVYKKLNKCAEDVQYDNQIMDFQYKRWESFFSKTKATVNDEQYIYLNKFTNNYENIKNTLINAKSYYKAYEEFNKALDKVQVYNQNKFNDIIHKIISCYDIDESKLKKEILKNKIIVDNNGNLTKSREEYDNANVLYSNRIDFYSMLTNVLLERNDVVVETKKLAVSYLKEIIKTSLARALESSEDKRGLTTIMIENWTGSTDNGSNEKELKEDLKNYLKRPFEKAISENTYFDIKVIICVISALLGLVVTIGLNFFAGLAVIIISLIFVYYFADKISKKKVTIENEFENVYKDYSLVLENVLAEVVDTYFTTQRANENIDYMNNYLDNFQIDSYVGER